MKTAMMQLRDTLENAKILHGKNKSYCEAFQMTINSIDSQMMEVERKQIVRAFQNGYDNKQLSHDYYTQTFINK